MSRNWITGVAIVIAMASTSLGQSDGFRIETDIFQDPQDAPIKQNLTLFYGDVAYDISRDDDQEITMVDPKRDRIVLLNTALEIQTEISISEIRRLMDSARQQAIDANLGAMVSSAEKVLKSGQRVVVGNENLKYAATLQAPSNTEKAQRFSTQYREFADAVKQLNALLSKGQPPFSRLALNAVVAEKASLPKEIEMTSHGGEQVLHCRLHATWLLSKSDESRIQEIGKKKVTFEAVSMTDYQQQMATMRTAGTARNVK